MRNRVAILVALLLIGPALALGSSGITITSHTTIFIDSREPQAIQRAAQDLAVDLGKVFGTPGEIVHEPTKASRTTLWISGQYNLPAGVRKPSGWEELRIQAVARPSADSPALRAIVLAGSDMRGTIFAIYQFSQEFLGVDPFYWWTDHLPPRRSTISVPENFSETQGPVFHYRGFFINDEDLLTGWAPGTKAEGTGISLKIWNQVFETILRLKGDMVAPGTWIFPDDPQVKLAGKRGLILTQHHAIPLGLNVARWPKDAPYNYSAHPEILERAWKDAVAGYAPGQEVLWTVGLRGLSDVSYAAMDPSVRGNNKALGQLIGRAITTQMKIVREAHPDAQFISSLWQEGARLVQQGFLSIPPEVHMVWADDGYGYIQDKGEVTAGQGVYDHVAMMNARANQLSEMVPVERSVSELGRFVKAGATHYLLLNTSDIRPVSMTAKAVMDIAWKGLPADSSSVAADYFRQWSADEFGARAATRVAGIYKDYFAAPATFTFGFGDAPKMTREYGDNYYHTQARTLLLTSMIDSPLYSLPSQSPKWSEPRIYGFFGRSPDKTWVAQTAKTEVERCGEAQARWDAIWKRAEAAENLVAPDRRPFYHAHVLAMIAINRESNRILFSVAKAVQDAQGGDKAKARAEAQDALGAFEEIHRAEAAAEYGRWKNWYRGDWLTNVHQTRALVQAFIHHLDDPLSPLPAPVLWSGWEAYYHIMRYEGDRNAEVR